MTNLQTLLPELNPSQLKMLERTLLEAVGEDNQYSEWSDEHKRFVIHHAEEVDTRNDLRAEIRANISALFKGEA